MSDKDEKLLSLSNLGAVQRKTSRFQSKDEDAWTAKNVSYEDLGGVKKKKGYAQRGSDLTTTTSTSSSTSTTTTSTSTSTTTSTTTSTSTS